MLQDKRHRLLDLFWQGIDNYLKQEWDKAEAYLSALRNLSQTSLASLQVLKTIPQ